MSCLRTRQMLDAWLDDELDTATGAALAGHASGCPDCRALRGERERLRADLRAAPRHAAPAALKGAIAARVRQARPPGARAPRMLTWWQALTLAGATGALAVLVTLSVLPAPGRVAVQAPLREQLVARHAAWLASGRLIDVASSDRHVVKPWFQGKVDFAPQVRDLSSLGFAIEGARLELVAGQSAVAVVYRIRKHPINLFVWRRADTTDAALEIATVRGFSVAAWSTGGLNYAAVSDTDAGETGRFARALLASP